MLRALYGCPVYQGRYVCIFSREQFMSRIRLFVDFIVCELRYRSSVHEKVLCLRTVPERS